MTTTTAKETVSGGDKEDGEATEKSKLRSDEKSDTRPESTPEAKPASSSTDGNSSNATATAAATVSSPKAEEDTKNKIEISKESKDTPSNPEDNDHNSSSVPKSEQAQGAAAK